MKLSLSLLAMAGAASAFAPVRVPSRPAHPHPHSHPLAMSTASSGDEAKPFFAERTKGDSSKAAAAAEGASAAAPALEIDGAQDPYAAIGIQEGELAIGVDAAEVLKWIGTKQELVAKFQRDNKGMDGDRAASEVGKFFMDAEMVNAYIKFEKDKVLNPPDLRAEAEQNLSDPKTIATYVAWLVGGASFGWIRNNIIEPKYASGEWEELHIQLPFFEQQKAAIESAAAQAADAAAAATASDAAAAAVSDSTVSAAVDAVSGSL